MLTYYSNKLICDHRYSVWYWKLGSWEEHNREREKMTVEKEKDRKGKRKRNRWWVGKKRERGWRYRELDKEPRGREDLSSFITDKNSYRSGTWHVLVQKRTSAMAHTVHTHLGAHLARSAYYTEDYWALRPLLQLTTLSLKIVLLSSAFHLCSLSSVMFSSIFTTPRFNSLTCLGEFIFFTLSLFLTWDPFFCSLFHFSPLSF